MSNNSSNTCIIKNKSIASLKEDYKLIIRGEWNMNEKIYLMEMQHRIDEHETDRLIAYLKKTAETEIKEDEK